MNWLFPVLVWDYFLSTLSFKIGYNWVHFESKRILLRIKGEPKIRISITWLQSDALITHGIWQNDYITLGMDSTCTPCKMMTIPTASSWRDTKEQSTHLPSWGNTSEYCHKSKPLGFSSKSRYNCFLILCDRYSMTFRPKGIQDKLTDAYFDGIELLVPRIPNSERKLKKNSI